MCAAKNTFKRVVKSKKLKKYASLCSEERLDQDYKCVQRGRSAEQLTKLHSDSNFKSDLTLQDLEDEILFPFDASNRLSQQVEVLLEENGQLRRSLVEAEARLRGVSKCPPGLATHGRASDLAASKIVELSKRVRELTADLEVARMRCRTFELSSVTSPVIQASDQPEQVIPDDVKSKESEIKELTDKLSGANLKVCEYRNQCQQLKHELKVAHKVLVNEVGEGVNIASLISGGVSSSWRGRAQQIQSLQQRINELAGKSSDPDLIEKEAKKAVSAARHQERELRVEHEREVGGLQEQLEERQKRLDAARARIRVLENTLSELKGRLATLLEKTIHDDQLISALTSQLATASDKTQDLSATLRLEQLNKVLEQQLVEEKEKCFHLQSTFDRKDKEIISLEEKLSELQNVVTKDNLEKSRNGLTDSFNSNNNSVLDMVGVAAEAERLRLLELLAINTKRLEHERQLAIKAQDGLRKERHKAARLETKLARQELERVSTKNGGYQSHSSPIKLNETITEELKCKIELLEEEVLLLRTRLSNVEQEKQDDLHTYTTMLENTRHTFLDAVKTLNTTVK